MSDSHFPAWLLMHEFFCFFLHCTVPGTKEVMGLVSATDGSVQVWLAIYVHVIYARQAARPGHMQKGGNEDCPGMGMTVTSCDCVSLFCPLLLPAWGTPE